MDTREKQLLIDSIINGFDIPKLYFREYTKLSPGNSDIPKYRYAIIDGKQRLTTTWQFIDGQFPLSDDFQYFRDPSIDAAGLTYKELASKHHLLRLEFDQTSLPTVAIMTEDDEIIEEMLSRLNEAVALSAAEKRNAFGGQIPAVIQRLASHRFFETKVPFSNNRYRHFDITAKFLLFEFQGGVSDTKKVYLDDLVRDFRHKSVNEATILEERVVAVLDRMADDFINSDDLLQRVGMISVYYLLYRSGIHSGRSGALSRSALVAFEKLKEENREKAEIELSEAEYSLLEFDRFAQSANDAVALAFRLAVLESYVYNNTVRLPAEFDYTSALRAVSDRSA